MSTCDECGAGIEEIPYKCSACGQTLCGEHRLSEKHACQETTSPTKQVRR